MANDVKNDMDAITLVSNREQLEFDKLRVGQLLCKRKLVDREEGRFEEVSQVMWQDLYMYHGTDGNLFTVINLESETLSSPKCRESYEWQLVTSEMTNKLNELFNKTINKISEKKKILERNELFKLIDGKKSVNFGNLWLSKFPMKEIAESITYGDETKKELHLSHKEMLMAEIEDLRKDEKENEEC